MTVTVASMNAIQFNMVLSSLCSDTILSVRRVKLALHMHFSVVNEVLLSRTMHFGVTGGKTRQTVQRVQMISSVLMLHV